MSFFGQANPYIAEYGYWAVGIGIMLEDFGLPAPGETLLISAAILASRGTFDIKLLLAVAWAGAVIGDNIGFCIGHFGGQRLMLRYGGRIGITQDRFDAVIRFFERYGAAVVIFARFVVLLRQLNGIVAGTLGMHWLRFLALNALGAALWVGFWGVLASWLGRRVFRMLDAMEHYEPLAIGIGAGLLAILVGLHFLLRFRRNRRRPS